MSKRISIFFLSIFLLGSCVSSKQEFIFRALPTSNIQTGFVHDDKISMEISFVGIMDEKYVFETKVTNLSEENIRVHSSQFVLRHRSQSFLHTEDLKRTIQELAEDQNRLAKRKKTNNWIAGISVGLGLVSGIAAQAPAEDIIFTIEPALDLTDENTWISRDIQSYEDYISYLETAFFDNDVIRPEESLMKDLFFNVIGITQDIEVEFLLEDLRYTVSFPRAAFSF